MSYAQTISCHRHFLTPIQMKGLGKWLICFHRYLRPTTLRATIGSLHHHHPTTSGARQRIAHQVLPPAHLQLNITLPPLRAHQGLRLSILPTPTTLARHLPTSIFVSPATPHWYPVSSKPVSTSHSHNLLLFDSGSQLTYPATIPLSTSHKTSARPVAVRRLPTSTSARPATLQ